MPGSCRWLLLVIGERDLDLEELPYALGAQG